MEETKTTEQEPRRSSWARIAGFALLGLHIVLWYPGVFVVPLLPIPVRIRLMIAGAMVAVGEIAFWACLPFLGKEYLHRYRAKLNPLRWFSKRKSADDGAEN